MTVIYLGFRAPIANVLVHFTYAGPADACERLRVETLRIAQTASSGPALVDAIELEARRHDFVVESGSPSADVLACYVWHADAASASEIRSESAGETG